MHFEHQDSSPEQELRCPEKGEPRNLSIRPLHMIHVQIYSHFLHKIGFGMSSDDVHSSIFRNTNHHFPNMSLRFEICVSLFRLLEGKDSIDYRASDFGICG